MSPQKKKNNLNHHVVSGSGSGSHAITVHYSAVFIPLGGPFIVQLWPKSLRMARTAFHKFVASVFIVDICIDSMKMNLIKVVYNGL